MTSASGCALFGRCSRDGREGRDGRGGPEVRDGVDVLVPDGAPLADALARTTDLGIGAHPDDIELFALAPIGRCVDHPDRWFTGVTCTDGAGSERSGSIAVSSEDELVALRREEQRRAAVLGDYGLMVQLGRSSASVRDPGSRATLVDDLVEVLDATRPESVWTHDLADRHPTHVAVGLAAVEAIRRLPHGDRPRRLVACEGWRSLDWLLEEDKLRLDVSAHADLAERLAAVFESQLAGKRYDLAEQGRRRANAVLADIRSADRATEVVLAMDLTELVRDDSLDPLAFVGAAVERFRAGLTGDTLRPD